MKRLLFTAALLFSLAAFAATVQKPVTTIVWDNPTTIAGANVASISFVCGTQSGLVTDAAQLTAGASGSAPLSNIITQDGTYTCIAYYTDTAGNVSPQAGPTEAVTRLNGNFTVAVAVPDAPGTLRFK